jgi:hypothetical protein
MLTKSTQSLRFRRSSPRGGRSYHKQNCYPKLRDMVRADFLLSGRVPADDIGYRFQYPSFNPALRHHVADYIGLNKQKILSKITQQQWFVYNFYTSCEEDIRVKVMKIFTGWQDKVPGLTDKMATINNQIKQCIITREQSLPGLLKVL